MRRMLSGMLVLFALAVHAADVAPLVLLDEAESISAWKGLVAVPEPKAHGDVAARWEGAGTGGVAQLRPAPADWSKHNCLVMELHADTADERHFIVAATSPTEASGVGSYFIHRLTVNWRGWRTVRIPLALFGEARSPKGWHAVESLTLHSRGWNVEPTSGTVIHLDNIRLEYSVKLARRKTPKRVKHPHPDLAPWVGKLAFPTFPWEEIFALGEQDKQAGEIIKGILAGSKKQLERPIDKRVFKLEDIPENHRDGRYKYAGDNGEVFALAMHDCRNGALLNSKLVPMAVAARKTNEQQYLDWVIMQLREVATWSPLQRPGWTQYRKEATLRKGGDGNWLATGYSMRAIVHTLLLVDDRLQADLLADLRVLLQKEIDSIQDDWESKRPWFVSSDYPATNQWVLPNAAMAYACLYLGDERNRGAYDMAVHNLARTCLAQGSDGSWSEGLSYGLMSAEYLFWAAWAMARNGDERLLQYGFARNFSDWVIHMTMPGGYCVNAFDCGRSTMGDRPHNSFLLSALLVDQPAVFWAGENLFPRLPAALSALLFRHHSATREGASAEPEPYGVYSHQQVLTWRSSWDRKHSIGLWIRGGSKRDSHCHRDNGHISIYNGREPILIESGTPSYSDRDLPVKYTPAAGHNTLQTGEVKPSGRGCHTPFTVHQLDESGGHVTVDGTNAFTAAEEWLRDIRWTRKGAVTISDRVVLNDPAPPETEILRFHTGSSIPLEISGGGAAWTVTWSTVTMNLAADSAFQLDQVPWPDRSGPKGHQCLRIMAVAPTRELNLTTKIVFIPSKPKGHNVIPYEQYRQQHQSASAGSDFHLIQAEDMIGNDPRFTVSTKKVGAKSSIYNWNDPRQTLTAKVEIKASGWYRIMLKCCTGVNHGIPVRSIALDGKLPFREAAALVFESTGGWSSETDDWQMHCLGDTAVADGYALFLPAGTRTVELVNEEGGGLNVDYIVIFPPPHPSLW
ncbi:MAG: heparinase II/III family protein, partial [Lentisphaeria bacterium]|nr:heparinase II/III family protein [Lentisphaeria bacterium]